jgi:SAM-dependent methyltransferase
MTKDLALQLFNEAHHLQSKGKIDHAEKLYLEGLKLDPRNFDALHFLGLIKFQKGEFRDAIENISHAALLSENNPHFLNNLGVAFHAIKDFKSALNCYSQAAEIQPSLVDAHFNKGNVLLDLGSPGDAFYAYLNAVNLSPNESRYWQNLSLTLPNLDCTHDTGLLADTLERMLKQPRGFDPKPVIALATGIIKTQPSMIELIYSPIVDFFECAQKISKLPLFLDILRSGTIADGELEGFLTRLRKSALLGLDGAKDKNDALNVLSALSTQCFIGEYVFFLSEEEASLIKDLEAKISKVKNLATIDNQMAVAVLSCYGPLYQYGWYKKINSPNNLDFFNEIIKIQINQVNTEKLLSKEIKALTPIHDAVSLKVKAQYEENPYPRWVSASYIADSKNLDLFAKELNPSLFYPETFSLNPSILIAGCGTGQHAIGAAARFNNCQVLAIDLSINSLSYALRKTKELGIQNIEYAQADILQLNKIGKQFDVIESGGVLHHMDDPMLGWKVLVDCLKPNGLMKIGLYSELARDSIVQARDLIMAKGFGNDEKSIRLVRQAILERLDGWGAIQELALLPDFYSMSNCRDLLFHVQEHRFSIPKLESCLHQLNLEFISFEFSSSYWMDEFKKIYGEGAQYSLDKWTQFELNFPKVFSGMYQFWVRKKSII